jgi:deoxycytidine triphosphate deaminase
MKRNAHYILSKIKDPLKLAKPAQVGVDLTVESISAILGNAIIREDTIHGGFQELSPQTVHLDEGNPFRTDDVWMLPPGAYAITFDQGLSSPLSSTENASITQRSSLNRNGVRVQGSIYDPGFVCDKLGATLYAAVPITIRKHARIAQLVIEENEPVAAEALYAGQYQGDIR